MERASAHGLFEVRRDRLFAKDMFPRSSRLLDLLRVELRGRADPHGVDVWVVDDVLGLLDGLGDSERGGGFLRRFLEEVADDFDAGFLAPARRGNERVDSEDSRWSPIVVRALAGVCVCAWGSCEGGCGRVTAC